VISGPVEGTAIGNLLVQAMGMGDLSNLTVAREVVARSFPVNRFTPRAGSASAWEQVQRRLSSLAKLSAAGGESGSSNPREAARACHGASR
jgi:hypothetical protein